MIWVFDEKCYEQLRRDDAGICLECGEDAEGFFEPDAEGRKCPECGAHACGGSLTYLMHFDAMGAV